MNITAHRYGMLSPKIPGFATLFANASGVAVALGLSAGSAMAGVEVVGGWEGSDTSDYAFVSPIFSFPVNPSGDILIKPAAHYLRYQTRDALGQTTVQSPGGSIGFSYRYHDPKLTIDIGPALEFIREERKPASGLGTTESKVGVLASANIFYQFDRNSGANVLTDYSETNHYFWSRGGLKTRFINRDYKGPLGLSIGPEVTYQTGNGVEQIGGGMMVELGLDRVATSLQFRGGYSRTSYSDNSHSSSPYFGVGLYHRF